MLSVWFGPMEGAIYNTAMYFRNTFQEGWLDDPLAKEMIKGVDRAEVLSGRLVVSRVLGPVSPYELSGGVKTLLLIRNFPELVFNASTCGDNCARWILKMGREGNVTVNLRHIMDFGGRKFTVKVLNTGAVVHTMRELALEAAPLLDGGMS